MDEFIQSLVKQLGLSPEAGKAATGNIMKMVRDQVGESTFSQIASKLPEVQRLIGAAEKDGGEQSGGGGGLMGSLTSMAGSLLGGKAGGAVEVASSLTKAGVSLDKVPQYLSLLVEFLKNKLGSDLFATVAAKLPDLLGKGK